MTVKHTICTVCDILLGVRPVAEWLLEFGFENFQYSDAYKGEHY